MQKKKKNTHFNNENETGNIFPFNWISFLIYLCLFYMIIVSIDSLSILTKRDFEEIAIKLKKDITQSVSIITIPVSAIHSTVTTHLYYHQQTFPCIILLTKPALFLN
jgi:hypothetical protein